MGFRKSRPCARNSDLRRLIDFADALDGLLALLDVLHQHDRRCVAVADVIAHFLRRAVVAIQHLAILRVQAQLRNFLIVHLDDVIVAILDEINIRLHGARARAPNNGYPAADSDAGSC